MFPDSFGPVHGTALPVPAGGAFATKTLAPGMCESKRSIGAVIGYSTDPITAPLAERNGTHG